eukprot:CAMPEP_0183706686 /NCGR_PEP_ID=MMETSP0737-20130205/3445_1 /TAXON_ID=385413 /ORGANISM="Thalassiosira miniscula, Strain CCMP1093" /LENGTH=808 /DNA_ID=CAMNT_0025934161 /DNA_START=81 /DNA_END=2507 /DNA_ORIENTATION=-
MAMARRAMLTRALDFVPRHRYYCRSPPPLQSSRPFASTTPTRTLVNGIIKNTTNVDSARGSGSTSLLLGTKDNNRQHQIIKRQFNFASSQYASCFEDIPTPDVAKLRKDAISYLDAFDKQSWYDDPVCSILNGEKLLAPPSNLWITKNSLSQPNGHQYFATPPQIQSLLTHIQTYQSPYTDLRPQVRRIEQKFLQEHAGLLIGNQCLDFAKQDGITEIEESIMANSVERKLNDALFQDEMNGKVSIARKPIFVSCVSNFTNFLDLFRKTLRNLELGIPCVVLGRSHTIQHSYRWTELLVDLMEKEGIDPGMVTYLSCQLEDIKYITANCTDSAGMLYTTCSRELAKAIKSNYPNTISSTGGPNTLITAEWTKGVQDAIRMSASIECAGQCTALRHAVVPESVQLKDIEAMFDDMTHVSSPVDALKKSAFDGVFDSHGGTTSPQSSRDAVYTKHATKDAYFKVGPAFPTPESGEMDEYWRKVVVDVTNAVPDSLANTQKLNLQVDNLSKWLIHHQPISLAVNAKRSQVFDLGRNLFEKTSLVVTTIGSTDKDDAPPAMTCQARPQDAECFGEFPPRKTMGMYTKYPVIIPSSTPSYDTSYQPEYLKSLAEDVDGESHPEFVKEWLKDISDPAVRGYCLELVRYLSDATKVNPKRGFGDARTALWGLQRPPLLEGYRTLLRCGPNVTFDDLSPIFILFYATNARSQVELSVDESNEELLDKLVKHDLDNHVFKVVVEGEEVLGNRLKEEGEDEFYNIVRAPSDANGDKFPMPGQFVSLYLPMGHIKSTMKNDEEFVKYLSQSDKWLKMAS